MCIAIATNITFRYTFVLPVDNDSAVLKYRMNTSKGSGGAPIFKENGGKLYPIAMHIGSEKSAKHNFGVLMSEVLNDIKGKPYSSSELACSHMYVTLKELTHTCVTTYSNVMDVWIS